MNERIKELAEQAFDIDLTLAVNSRVSVVIKVEHLERFAELVRQDYLRELKALKLVGYMDRRGILFNWTTHPHLNTALYALDEVKHD